MPRGRIRPIRIWPDPVLRMSCQPVDDPARVADLCADMLATLYAAGGRGLAAPQVGHLLRVFVMDVNWKEGAPDPLAVINPEILWTSPQTVAIEEVCLSIPDAAVSVVRPAALRMAWTDERGTRHEDMLEGAAARVAQHEIDHLDGIVTFDRADAGHGVSGDGR